MSEYVAVESSAELTGNDLVDAITDATRDAETNEQSHAAAIAALNDERKRGDLFTLRGAAEREGWSDDRLASAQAEVEARYATKQ